MIDDKVEPNSMLRYSLYEYKTIRVEIIFQSESKQIFILT